MFELLPFAGLSLVPYIPTARVVAAAKAEIGNAHTTKVSTRSKATIRFFTRINFFLFILLQIFKLAPCLNESQNVIRTLYLWQHNSFIFLSLVLLVYYPISYPLSTEFYVYSQK